MKSKNLPSRARASKIPPKSSSMAARVLNKMLDVIDVDCSGPHAQTEELGQPGPTKRLKRSVTDVQEAQQDEFRRDIWVNETKDDSEPSIVPETQGGSDGCHDDGSPDLNYEVITDKAKHIFTGSPGTLNWDSLTTLEWTEQGLCIICNKGDQVLNCCSSVCPLAVHECCLGCPPSFDDMGNFYCPLCSYKQALSESHEAEKELSLAKKKVHLARDSFSQFISGSCQEQPAERIHRRELNQSRIDGNIGSIHVNREQRRKIGSGKSVEAVEDQRVAEEAMKCINDNLKVKAPLVSKRNDPSLMREGRNAKEVGNNQHKNVEDQNEAQASVRCTDGNIMADKYQATKISDVPTRGENGELVDSDQHKLVEDQQVAASVGCTNDNLGVEDSILLRDLFGGPQTQKKRNDNEMGIENQCIREAEQHMRSETNTGVGTSNSPCRDNLFDGPQNHQKRNDTKMVEECQHVSDVEPQMHSESNIGFETSNACRRDIETVTVLPECTTWNAVEQPKIVDPQQKSSSKESIGAEENAMNQNEKKTISNNSEKQYKSIKRSSNPALPNSRRKRLHWTLEEEEMLKEAVQKFSGKTGKNLSWRNILEFGCNVFNESRTPVDLKDKWRNMTKEGSISRLRRHAHSYGQPSCV